MAERLTYIRAKYEQRSFYGPPTRESLRAAAGDSEMRLEQLPSGYMEGVETSGTPGAGGEAGGASTPSSGSAASGGSGGSSESGGALNPAVARRLAKKREEEEAARAVAAAAASSSMGDSEWTATPGGCG